MKILLHPTSSPPNQQGLRSCLARNHQTTPQFRFLATPLWLPYWCWHALEGTSFKLVSHSAGQVDNNNNNAERPCLLASNKLYCLKHIEQAVREATTICPHPLQVDLLTLKVVSKSRVTWPTSVPISVFLGLSVLDLGPMYVTDRQTSDVHHRLMPYLGAGHNNAWQDAQAQPLVRSPGQYN